MNPRLILTALLASGGFISALPVDAAAEMTLYRGEPAASQNLILGGWGSGFAQESQRVSFSGSNSIEIHTDGYYAGGRIDFSPTVDLGDAFAERDTYLVFTVRFPALATDEEFSDFGPGAFPGRPPGLPPGAAPGGAGGDVTLPAVGFFRIVMVVNGVSLTAEDQPIDIRRTEGGWTTISIPLAAFKGTRPTGGRAALSRILIFGDRPEPNNFFIGEIRTTIDDAEITLEETPEEQFLNPGDQVQLMATASAGLASVEFVWDFDKTDGLQEEAFGEATVHSWRDPGDYVVTLRVRDLNGIKPELREEIPVTVTP